MYHPIVYEISHVFGTIMYNEQTLQRKNKFELNRKIEQIFVISHSPIPSHENEHIRFQPTKIFPQSSSGSFQSLKHNHHNQQRHTFLFKSNTCIYKLIFQVTIVGKNKFLKVSKIVKNGRILILNN